MKYRNFQGGFLVLLIFSMALFSCQKQNLKPGIPAFIKIDTIYLATDYSTQGTCSHNITDVWVYVNEQRVGAFELPAMVPILMDGTAKLRLEAGIKVNGIATTRVNNPFYEPYIAEGFNFVPDSVVSISPTTHYRQGVEFAWKEDFENNAISLDTSNLSGNLDIVLSAQDEAFEGFHSGMIYLDTTYNFYEGATFEPFTVPIDGSPIVLEMNYKTDIVFEVGIFASSPSNVVKKPVLYVNPSTTWNKIYINLSDAILENNFTDEFKIYFRAGIYDEFTEAAVGLDNIKVVFK